MNALTKIETGTAIATWTPRQLETIKRTVARDTSDDEFNLFIEYAKVKGLDPFSRQVIAIIFNKDKPEKRQMTIITTQEGLRVMAARCGDYRPAEEEPAYEYGAEKTGTNPLGLVKCTVKLWKQDPRTNQWFPVSGTAYWDEHAPIKEEWAWNEQANKRKPTGKLIVEDNWRKMGRFMLAKCATTQALRAGWPATFSGVYGEEEMDRAITDDRTASEIVAMEAEVRRAKAIGMSDDEYPFVDDQGNMHFIPAGEYGDRLIEEARAYKTAEPLQAMIVRNREGFNRFWAKHKSDALEVKRSLEGIGEKLSKVAA